MPGIIGFNKGAEKKKSLKNPVTSDQMDISTITWGELTW